MKKQLLLPMLALCGAFILGGCSVLGGTSSDSSSNNSQSSQVKTYTVTFQQPGQADIQKKVNEGESLTEIPTVKSKTGYNVSWEDVDLTNISKDIVVKAVEIPKEYTITYDVNGGDALASSTQTVTYDAEYTLATPTREDWGFQGWQYGDEVYVAGTHEKWNIDSDVTFTAQWIDERPNVYITFVQYSRGEWKTFVKKGEVLPAEKIDPPKYVEGYTFDMENWYADEECTTVFDFSQPIMQSVTVYAKPIPNTYTVSYDLNYEGAPSVDPLTVTYHEDYTLMADPVREGYEFTGWKAYNSYGSEVQLWRPWAIDSDVTLKAQWEEIIPETYVLTFIYNGSAHTTITLIEGETLATDDIPAIPTAETGYHNVGWCVDESCTVEADFATIASTTTLYAKLVANKYEITYLLENATIDGEAIQIVTFGEAYQLKTPVHNVEGYTFMGWVADETPVSAQGTWSIANNVMLTPVWEDNRVTYTVTFMRGNTIISQASAKRGDVILESEIPVIEGKTGYTVDTENWYADIACTTIADLTQGLTSSFNVYVKETVNTYTVTYNAADGKLPNGVEATFTIAYGETISLATPTRTGFTFNGWFYRDANGNLTKITNGSVWKLTENTTLIAQWVENKEWTNNY